MTYTTSISLLERVKKLDDDGAWGRLVELYTPLVFHWAQGIGLKPHEASDLVQDVFLTLVEKLPTFQYDQGKTFRGWLRTVTLNKCRDVLRRGAAQQLEWSEDIADDEPPSSEFLSEQEYSDAIARQALQLMRSEFEPKTWKACWLSVASGRRASEIADELGMTVNAVYLARSRVLRRLREEFSGLLDEIE